MAYSSSTMNPSGGVDAGRAATQPSLHDELMAQVLDSDNVRRAWKRVKSNKGAPGIDGMTLGEFDVFAREHWPGIRQAISDGSYQPQPVRRVRIPKPGGKGERLLGIPTITDRVIQQAIAQILTPIFDPEFSESSFGFRPKRSAHGALRKIQRHVIDGNRIAVDIDLEKFFDNVDHDILMNRIARRVGDKRLLGLIGRFLRAGACDGDLIQPTDIGAPQGGPLSPLLSNILLDDLDRELESRGHRFARYADDLLIVVKSERAGERVKSGITKYLTDKLKLKVNEQKSRVVKTNEVVFLGFTFRGKKLRWCEQAFADFKHRLRRLTSRRWGVSMNYRYHKLARYIRGWMNYFGISQYYRPIQDLDGWLRRRIRMCYWKQWRRPRTKIRHLKALGTSLSVALRTACSRKGYWRLSKTLATQTGMTNKWLASQGLVSIKACWCKSQGYA